jgi:hypothetical protein
VLAARERGVEMPRTEALWRALDVLDHRRARDA